VYTSVLTNAPWALPTPSGGYCSPSLTTALHASQTVAVLVLAVGWEMSLSELLLADSVLDVDLEKDGLRPLEANTVLGVS
jgi:hypothetical protein